MERIQIGEVSLEVLIAGEGPPLLFLHGGDYFAQNRGFLDRLARRWRVVDAASSRVWRIRATRRVPFRP